MGPFSLFNCSKFHKTCFPILHELQQRGNLAWPPRARRTLPVSSNFLMACLGFQLSCTHSHEIDNCKSSATCIKKRPGYRYLLDFFSLLGSIAVGHFFLATPLVATPMVAGVVGLAVECGIPAEKMPQADPAPYGMARFIGGWGSWKST